MTQVEDGHSPQGLVVSPSGTMRAVALSEVELRTVLSLALDVVGHGLTPSALCCGVDSALGSGGIFRVRSNW